MVFVQGWAREILNVAHLSLLRLSFHWLHQVEIIIVKCSLYIGYVGFQMSPYAVVSLVSSTKSILGLAGYTCR